MKSLLEQLIRIRDNPPHYGGICSVLQVSDRMLTHKLMREWPKFSGNPTFPVPHPTKDPEIAYIEDYLWDLDTEYGRNRMELVNWLISQLAPPVLSPTIPHVVEPNDRG